MCQFFRPQSAKRRTVYNRLEGDGVPVNRGNLRRERAIKFGLRLLLLRLEFAINRDVGILVQTRVRLHPRLRLGTASEDSEIMVQKTRSPFERSQGMIVLQRVRLTLRLFDEFTIGHAGGRPVFWEMVSVEFEESVTEAGRAHNDAFAACLSHFGPVHGSPEAVNADTGTEIAHAFGATCRRRSLKSESTGLQTVNYDIFQVP